MGVEGHEAADAVGFERGDLRQRAPLRLAQVGDDGACRANRQRQSLAAERFQRGHGELLLQALACHIFAEGAQIIGGDDGLRRGSSAVSRSAKPSGSSSSSSSLARLIAGRCGSDADGSRLHQYLGGLHAR